jgi:hypothetical protein
LRFHPFNELLERVILADLAADREGSSLGRDRSVALLNSIFRIEQPVAGGAVGF